MTHPVPAEILRQLGGNMFRMMTGAKDFMGGNDRLTFRIGRNAKGVNMVRIILEPSDLYTMEFMAVRNCVFKMTARAEEIYNEDLTAIFTEHTGLDVRL